MTNFKKEYKKLYKIYKKRLRKLHEYEYDLMQPPIHYFVTYLQFLRDRLLLESPLTEKLGEDNIELASIVSALDEYEKYTTCIYKFYNVENGVITRKAEFSEEEAKAKYQEEHTYHWEAFWNLVKLCIDGWGADVKF